MESKIKQKVIEEIDLHFTQWLYDFANKPLKERKNAYVEVRQFKEDLLNKIKNL